MSLLAAEPSLVSASYVARSVNLIIPFGALDSSQHM